MEEELGSGSVVGGESSPWLQAGGAGPPQFPQPPEAGQWANSTVTSRGECDCIGLVAVPWSLL